MERTFERDVIPACQQLRLPHDDHSVKVELVGAPRLPVLLVRRVGVAQPDEESLLPARTTTVGVTGAGTARAAGRRRLNRNLVKILTAVYPARLVAW
jgi:hypothetical protein